MSNINQLIVFGGHFVTLAAILYVGGVTLFYVVALIDAWKK